MAKTREQRLIAALEAATGAVVALKDAIGARDADAIVFTGSWSRLGRRTLGSILDQTDAALGAVKPEHEVAL